MTILHKVVESLLADVDTIVEMKGPKPETAPLELVEDTVLVELFTTPIAPLPDPRERAKRHRSSRTTKGDKALGRKGEGTDLEATRRASLVDEEII